MEGARGMIKVELVKFFWGYLKKEGVYLELMFKNLGRCCMGFVLFC